MYVEIWIFHFLNVKIFFFIFKISGDKNKLLLQCLVLNKYIFQGHILEDNIILQYNIG